MGILAWWRKRGGGTASPQDARRIEEAVKPCGTDFPSLLKLRDQVRNAILAHCGEPDIAELVKPDV